jgi:hypothetical protein
MDTKTKDLLLRGVESAYILHLQYWLLGNMWVVSFLN